ncbi:MAG: patatin-like phospholipase family protein [Candidatus Dormibacteraeota bacterium]|nr:patatin-like phospholipase family protein [Candidatus Dormibacteraeota bacterium]
MIHWRRDRTAFALSGGGARGALQVGMLRALLEHGIRPDLVVGVSIGAWNGAWLAHRPELEWVERLDEVWRNVSRQSLDMVWWRAARNMVRRRPSLYEGSGLARLIGQHLHAHNFEDLAVPLHTVAIDLTLGIKSVFSRGPLAPAVLASSAIPGIFPPVTIDDHQHVDGGMVDPTGLDTAIELGARRIFVLDSGYAGQLPAPLASMNAIVDHTFQIAAQHRTRWTIQQMGRSIEIVHLRPSAGFLRHSMDFGATASYLDEGYRYTIRALEVRRKGRRPAPAAATGAPVYH